MKILDPIKVLKKISCIEILIIRILIQLEYDLLKESDQLSKRFT